MSEFGDKESGDRAPRKPHKRREYAPRELRPIDAAQLQELAIGYAARYATTAVKLQRYLERKLKERRWTPADAPDLPALVARVVAAGFVDDRAFAAAKQRDLTARGFGLGRVKGALAAAGVSRDDVNAVLDEGDRAPDVPPYNPYASAISFARRRRFGPFARDTGTDPARRNRDLAAMARAGHAFAVARSVLMAADETAALELSNDG